MNSSAVKDSPLLRFLASLLCQAALFFSRFSSTQFFLYSGCLLFQLLLLSLDLSALFSLHSLERFIVNTLCCRYHLCLSERILSALRSRHFLASSLFLYGMLPL